MAEKVAGRPLLCAVSKKLPDKATIRMILSTWMRVYGLNATSIEEGHVALINQSLFDYIDHIIKEARKNVVPSSDQHTLINPDHINLKALNLPIR